MDYCPILVMIAVKLVDDVIEISMENPMALRAVALK
jgi:hypothetical protein